MYTSSLTTAQRYYSTSLPDLRSRTSMATWLANHFPYDTMGSWNDATAYANCVKLPRLGLTQEQEDRAYSFLQVPTAFNFIHSHIDAFTSANHGRYTVGQNGRSGGYLVMYPSAYQESKHKSVCTECGQLNFREVFSREGLPPNELAVAEFLCSQSNFGFVDAVLRDAAFQALAIPVEQNSRASPDYSAQRLVAGQAAHC